MKETILIFSFFISICIYSQEVSCTNKENTIEYFNWYDDEASKSIRYLQFKDTAIYLGWGEKASMSKNCNFAAIHKSGYIRPNDTIIVYDFLARPVQAFVENDIFTITVTNNGDLILIKSLYQISQWTYLCTIEFQIKYGSRIVPEQIKFINIPEIHMINDDLFVVKGNYAPESLSEIENDKELQNRIGPSLGWHDINLVFCSNFEFTGSYQFTGYGNKVLLPYLPFHRPKLVNGQIEIFCHELTFENEDPYTRLPQDAIGYDSVFLYFNKFGEIEKRIEDW